MHVDSEVQLRQEDSLDSLSLVQVRRARITQINEGGGGRPQGACENRARDGMAASHRHWIIRPFEELIRLMR